MARKAEIWRVSSAVAVASLAAEHLRARRTRRVDGDFAYQRRAQPHTCEQLKVKGYRVDTIDLRDLSQFIQWSPLELIVDLIWSDEIAHAEDMAHERADTIVSAQLGGHVRAQPQDTADPRALAVWRRTTDSTWACGSTSALARPTLRSR